MKEAIKHVYHATIYSMHGLKALFHDELAFRIEIVCAAVVIPLIYFIELELVYKLILFSLLWLLLIVEALNSAIEKTVDRISSDHHHLSKKAKDIGSAAVFLTYLLNGLVWFFILIN